MPAYTLRGNPAGTKKAFGRAGGKMRYISTRGNCDPVSSSFALYKGMVPGGGLFVPESFPSTSLAALSGEEYKKLAHTILSLFLTDYSAEELSACIDAAYNDRNFDSEVIAPLFAYDPSTAYLELWRGPTAAFKDLALQIMPRLFVAAMRKEGTKKEAVILVATSGDTGKAALEGFKNVPGTKIIVFYPKNGVSLIQEAQMLTTVGDNTTIIGVRGNFDDCQNMVKEIFDDTAFAGKLAGDGYEFSSANSINWGRLVPQIVYYFYAYLGMVRQGALPLGGEVNFAVPTGNFGNILAGYYAKLMGLPVKKLICASNSNRILTDFFETGVYDKNREFVRTSSPSMDILISSNLERFLFSMAGGDGGRVAKWQAGLAQTGRFSVESDIMEKMGHIIACGSVSEPEVMEEIRRVCNSGQYLIDTHTAVASAALKRYREKSNDHTPAVIVSTASAYKVCQSVYDALALEGRADDEHMLIGSLSDMTGAPIPRAFKGLENLKPRSETVIEISGGRDAILAALKKY
jgi:threonine synthase